MSNTTMDRRRGEVRRHPFRAMGTGLTLIGPASEHPDAGFERAAREVERIFGEVERRFSRFLSDSELSMVNARSGRWTNISPEFEALLRFSLDAAAKTGGLFDPTILPALQAAGYDRDFKEIEAGDVQSKPPPKHSGRWHDVDVLTTLVHVPRGCAVDFGGVAKGWAVDLAADDEAVRALPWAVIDAGGDLRLVGRPPSGSVEIGIEDPERQDQEVLRLQLQRGALATSSVNVRAWGQGRHHIIDPRTSRPARTGVLQATVWAETCAQAEVLAKWALLTGLAAMDRVPAALVLEGGRVMVNMDREVAA